jgi:hypothetical protein
MEKSHFYRSIVREVKSTGSTDSDCISLDDPIPPAILNCNKDSSSPLPQRHDQDFPLSSSSPNSYRKTQPVAELPHRSHSADSVTFRPLHETTTGDSGTGDSIIQVPTEISAKLPHYEAVPVFGQSRIVLMANRYEFDPAKVAEYLPQKPTIPGSISGPSLTLERRPEFSSSQSKKPNKILSLLLKPFKSSPTHETYITPLIRHHSSHTLVDDNR